MNDLVKLNISHALDGLAKKEFSALELTKAHLRQMEKYRHLNPYILETPEIALQSANESDKRIGSGNMLPVDGIPIGIKDLFCTKNVRTTACSKMLHEFVPAYDSTVSRNIMQSGAIMLGKTNMDEFAMGSSNMTSYFGHVINPWRGSKNQNLTPGGSSGGSAAAVAGYMAMACLGSDTGGSVRQPAAFTGLVGIKPTYGRCSRYGMIAYASSLDQAGVFARTVEDSAIILESIMGFDDKDSTSANIANIQNLRSFAHKSIRGMKIGVPVDVMKREGISAEILSMWNNAISALKSDGADIVEISLPHSQYALSIYYTVSLAEASSNLARYDGVRYGFRVERDGMSLDDMYELTRSEGFGKEVKRRMIMGAHLLSSGFMDAYYIKAQKVRRLVKNDFDAAFQKVDAILQPSAPTDAFALDYNEKDPVAMYLNDIFTIPASLAGLPCISVPFALSKAHLPLGMQLIGSAFAEDTVIQCAAALERLCDIKFIPGGF